MLTSPFEPQPFAILLGLWLINVVAWLVWQRLVWQGRWMYGTSDWCDISSHVLLLLLLQAKHFIYVTGWSIKSIAHDPWKHAHSKWSGTRRCLIATWYELSSVCECECGCGWTWGAYGPPVCSVNHPVCACSRLANSQHLRALRCLRWRARHVEKKKIVGDTVSMRRSMPSDLSVMFLVYHAIRLECDVPSVPCHQIWVWCS